MTRGLGAGSYGGVAVALLVAALGSFVVMSLPLGLVQLPAGAIVGLAGGLVGAGRPAGILAAMAGALAGWLAAAVLNAFAFLGDAWPVALGIFVALVALGYGGALLLRRPRRQGV